MSSLVHYFRNAAADISYSPAGYLRTDWHSMAAEPVELQAIYEHVLWAMKRYHVVGLLFVHRQIEAIPEAMQHWLVSNWIPRAMQQAGYERCAIVEVGPARSQQAVRAIGQQVPPSLQYAFFDTPEAASAWLLPGPPPL